MQFHGGFKKLIPFSHLFQILYELEKKSSLVTRALSAKSCTRDTDSLHSCTRLRLVQEMACLNHSCKIWPRKHSYPNLIPIVSSDSDCIQLQDDLKQAQRVGTQMVYAMQCHEMQLNPNHQKAQHTTIPVHPSQPTP